MGIRVTRYVAIPPRAWMDDSSDYVVRPTCDVLDTPRAPEPIGILDASGTPIYRIHETMPMGFQAPEPKPRARTRKRR